MLSQISISVSLFGKNFVYLPSWIVMWRYLNEVFNNEIIEGELAFFTGNSIFLNIFYNVSWFSILKDFMPGYENAKSG